MCWCNPSLRTPCCGSINCYPPKAYTLEEQKLRSMLKECTILLIQGTEDSCKDLVNTINKYLEEK